MTKDGIKNSVITVTLNVDRLDLDEIAASIPDAKFEPERFMAVILKRQDTAFLIFSSGKMTLTGKSPVKEKKKVLREFIDELHHIGIANERIKVEKYSVENVVGNDTVGDHVDLDRLALEVKDTMYEPEQFPGLIWRRGDCTVLVFGKGSFVLTGLKSESAFETVNEKVKRELGPFVVGGKEDAEGDRDR